MTNHNWVQRKKTNKSKGKKKRNKKLKDNALYPKRQRRQAGVRAGGGGEGDNFMDAFKSIRHNPTLEQQERDEETLRIITEQIENDMQHASESGDFLYVSPPPVCPVVANVCRGCSRVCGSGHKCDRCGSNMHPFCGRPIGEEGHGQIIRCRICDKK